MPEPTLKELREIANRLLDEIDAEIARDRIEGFDANFTSPTVEPRIAVLQAFLSLTDPTPLDAEHCREEGLGNSGAANKRWDFGRNYVWLSDTPDMHIEHPTRGQLRLALMRENSDDE